MKVIESVVFTQLSSHHDVAGYILFSIIYFSVRALLNGIHCTCTSNSSSQALSEAQSMLSAASTDEAKAEAQIAVEVAEELIKAAEA